MAPGRLPRSAGLRSGAWLGGDDEVALNHRAALRAAGVRRSRALRRPHGSGRPLIGIACTASDLNRCDRGLSVLAAAVRRGVTAAGGLPLEFPVMSLSEDLMKPTAMLYRNLLAIEVEETIRSQPLDGIVALGNCDKTVPAYLMALASADIPALIVTGGFRPVSTFRGERLGSGTALWRLYDARRAGALDDAAWARLETCLGRGLGACNTMGTASTMAIMAEALGMTLPGSAVLASGDPLQLSLAEEAGRRIVTLVRDGVRPSALLTAAGFEQAITVLAAIGGSTNAIIHLCAVAGRRGLSLPLSSFGSVSARTPVILDVAPVGSGLMDDLARAGGVPAVLEALAGGPARWPLGAPVTSLPAFMVVRGNLAPDGAVIKAAAASPSLLRHRGPAVVFHSYEEMRARVDDPFLDVGPDSVLVLAGCGPAGMAMPEWGNIPVPAKLLGQGVTDLLRITDGRMSGTGFGTVVLHVAPESAAGGPLSRLRDGDVVTLDAYAGSLSVAADLAGRDPVRPVTSDRRGWPVLHRMHVLQAPEGCDYDFLRPRTSEDLAFVEPVIGRSLFRAPGGEPGAYFPRHTDISETRGGIATMTVARFVGIGVGDYERGHAALQYAVPDVEAVAGLLAKSFECTLLRNPDEQSARSCLAGLRGSIPEGGSLVLYWSGHAIRSSADGPRLLARDSQSFATSGLGATGDTTGPCAESGANQLLFIIDTCFSGEAAAAVEVATHILQQSAPEGKHIWVGVLTSCLPTELARDGEFGQLLFKLLEGGPEPGPDTKDLLVRRWSPQSEFISGYDLCDTLLKTWGSQAHSPDFRSSGSALAMFRNPLHQPRAPGRVVEHLLRAARGGAAPDEHSWFTGRTIEVDQVVGWVRSGRPGIHVITGSAGTGKTAIAGRVVSLSDPAERQRLMSEGQPVGHADPGERSVAAHVHARALTADAAADLIAGQLVQAGLLTDQPDQRNAAELVGQVQRAVEQGGDPPVIVLDGLDEARAHAFEIAEDLLLRLAPYATVIVATRERRRGATEPSLLDVLTAGTAELNLDDSAAQDRSRTDLRAYVAWRLTDVDPAMDPDAVADYLAASASMTGSSPFLLARLVTDQLRASPVDTSQPDWQVRVSDSVEDAFDADLDLARITGASARTLLAALTWGLGAGLPEEEWLACANAFGHGGFGTADVSWVLDELGRYIVQDGEAGVAVYRMAHQSLADHIRPPFAATYEQVFDPQALPVAAALLGRYIKLLHDGVPVDSPAYLWRYAGRHAAAAGLAGLDLLRPLAAAQPGLLADVAAAGQEVGTRLAAWGYLLEAVAPTEEAVGFLRQLMDDPDSTLRPNLANALTDLGIRYSQVGRPNDALAPSEEAVQIYRDLAQANPAFQPNLATALANLGIRYGELGRRHDALGPVEESVRLYRDLAGTNPAFRPNLASVLANLGVRYSEVGRRHDALDPTEESVRLYRDLAQANPAFPPDLASALSNLGVRYSELGRYRDALDPTEESVRLYRDLAGSNPAFRPNLASVLANLGVRYSELGRRHEAPTPTEEAIRLYRDLAGTNPAFRPNLASALSNLGVFYSELGRYRDALDPTEEAIRLYRDLARINPAFQPDLATALSNLGIRYSELGRYLDALAPVEEAVELYRVLAQANPAFRPNLATALSNLGIRHSELGRYLDALAPTEEAVQLYRDLARTNPAFQLNLATALSNLGVRLSQLGQRDNALAPSEEAVQLYRDLSGTNPAFQPNLATALSNLGIRHSELGRYDDALGPTEEAVRLFRDLAGTNPAFQPNFATALSNLGIRYSELGRYDDALAPSEEAVRLFRDLAGTNPAFQPNFATALTNLGIRYSELGRYHEALAPSAEAVRLYRDLARINPAFMRSYAVALTNVAARYAETGTPELGDAAWDQAIGAAAPPGAAYLLVTRAAAAQAGQAGAADWLARAIELAGDTRPIVAAAHRQALRHRGADPAVFDAHWARTVPEWLTVDPVLLSTAEAWIAAGSYPAERDYLAAHPELLAAAADVAVAEALLTVPEDAASRFSQLREAAQRDGAEAAYRPLLLIVLAREFAEADPDRQRALLAERRDDLLSDTVAGALRNLAAWRAMALLDLARAGDAEPVLDALADPARFPPLLHALACRADAASLVPAATLASHAATTSGEAATAGFYLAAGTAINGVPDLAADMAADPAADLAAGLAADLARKARELDPAQVPDWIDELAEIGGYHRSVLPLIPVLTARKGDRQ